MIWSIDLQSLSSLTLFNRLSEDTIQTIIRDAVAIEQEFITQSIPCAMIGMNAIFL